MIEDVWKLTKVNNKYRLVDTKLTEKHFNRDAYSRINIALAVQLLSNSIKNILVKLLNNENIRNSLRLRRNQYKEIEEMMAHMNSLVDICNRRFNLFNSSNRNTIIQQLLLILSWFSN